MDTERKNAGDKNQKLEVVSIIKDSFEVQKLIKQLIQSGKENVSLAIPMTAADLFFSSHPPDISPPPPPAPSDYSSSVFFQLIKDVAENNKSLSVKILTNAEHQEREKEEDSKKKERRNSPIFKSGLFFFKRKYGHLGGG